MREESCGTCRLLPVATVMTLLGWLAVQTGTAGDSLGNTGAQLVVASGEPNDLRWDLAAGFEFSWDAVELSSKVLANDTVSTGTHTLAIDVRIGILDTKRVVAVDVNRPEISEVYDGDGRIVEYLPDPVLQVRRYEQNGWYWDDMGARPPEHWYRGKLVFRLVSDPNHALPSSISRLIAYVHVTYGKVVNVDVPFGTSTAEWLAFDATPDLLFRVDPSTPPRPGPIE